MTTTVQDLDGLFKEVYEQSYRNLIPEAALIQRAVKFSTAQKIGKKFNAPVVVAAEGGFTYAAPDSGAFALNSAISMKTQNAELDASQIMLRAAMSDEAAYKSMAGDKAAFVEATSLQIENMMDSMGKRIELALLYGQSGLGVADSSANVSATSTKVTLTAATFASGIWSGSETHEIQFFDKATGARVSSGADSNFTIAGIDPTNKAITVTGTATGITALDTALAAAGQADIFWRSARVSASVYNEMVGIDKIVTNTGSLFGIDAGTYSLWAGNTYAAAGALTFAKLQAAVALPVARGGLMEDVTVYINPTVWSSLLTEQSALRKLDSSYSQAQVDNGSKSIKFFSQNGSISVQAHPYVKPGDAFVLPLKHFKRVGSTDVVFGGIGTANGKIFTQMPDNAGFQYRCYTGQAVLCDSPAKALKITGIA
jgi:hypothetical protein